MTDRIRRDKDEPSRETPRDRDVEGTSYGATEREQTEDLRRRAVIEGPTADLGVLVKHRLSLWSRRLIPAGYH